MGKMELSIEEKKILLNTARLSIQSHFRDVVISDADYETFPTLKRELGAFVTIKINGELRGCIGYIVGHLPLYETIAEVAKQAAFGDPRFKQLTEEEFENIQVEISVLSPFEAIESYDEIEVGKHGLMLDEGGRAVLLPQVATEHNYNRSEFLTALCHKAGLYGDYWKERMLKIKVFTALVFEED
jgi:AmmeMemoRadiSam system protein A